jgi:hypothetical protein
LSIKDDPAVEAEQDHEPTSFSYRFLGHRAFRELLARLGHPTQIARRESVIQAGEEALLVVAEPWTTGPSHTFEVLQFSRAKLLVVLPKWQPPIETKNYKGPLSLSPTSKPKSVLLKLELPGELVRVATPKWLLESDQQEPDLRSPTQLISLESVSLPNLVSMEPIIQSEEGMLVARIYGGGIDCVVISDPDLLSNHGLVRSVNAEIAVKIVRGMIANDAPVLFDETLHGYSLSPSLIRSVLRFPLVLAVVQALILIAGLVAIASQRFGRPLPEDQGTEAGKRVFLENLTSLRSSIGKPGYSVDQYFLQSLRAVGAEWSLKEGADLPERIKRLDQISGRIGTTHRPSALAERMAQLQTGKPNPVDCLKLAVQIQSWRKEMVHGIRRT